MNDIRRNSLRTKINSPDLGGGGQESLPGVDGLLLLCGEKREGVEPVRRRREEEEEGGVRHSATIYTDIHYQLLAPPNPQHQHESSVYRTISLCKGCTAGWMAIFNTVQGPRRQTVLCCHTLYFLGSINQTQPYTKILHY
jgi:hypothetical protein